MSAEQPTPVLRAGTLRARVLVKARLTPATAALAEHLNRHSIYP
jgi:hypothetical protein